MIITDWDFENYNLFKRFLKYKNARDNYPGEEWVNDVDYVCSVYGFTNFEYNLADLAIKQNMDLEVAENFFNDYETKSGIHNLFRYVADNKGVKYIDKLIEYLCDGSVHACLFVENNISDDILKTELQEENEYFKIYVEQEYNGYFDVAWGNIYIVCDDRVWGFSYTM